MRNFMPLPKKAAILALPCRSALLALAGLAGIRRRRRRRRSLPDPAHPHY